MRFSLDRSIFFDWSFPMALRRLAIAAALAACIGMLMHGQMPDTADQVRLRELERRINSLDAISVQVAVLKEQIEQLVTLVKAGGGILAMIAAERIIVLLGIRVTRKD